MARLFAFLRAINVGGHTVAMPKLKGIFEGLGLADVETFIASGNVIFRSPSKSLGTLERKIETDLQKTLGYEVKTFIRTAPELVALAAHKPFLEARIRSAGAYCIGFLAQPLDAVAKKALFALKTPIDDFQVHEREVYWLCKTRQAESTFSNVRFEKSTGAKVTFRGINTVAKLAAKAQLDLQAPRSNPV
jgi:uncharacterized protein (DUF1697 family)